MRESQKHYIAIKVDGLITIGTIRSVITIGTIRLDMAEGTSKKMFNKIKNMMEDSISEEFQKIFCNCRVYLDCITEKEYNLLKGHKQWEKRRSSR